MINYLANPVRFIKFSKVAAPICGLLSLIFITLGLWLALIASPPDQEHGDTVRILYVHVPAAWSALASYTALAIASLVGFIWRHPLADSAAKAIAIPGAAFTFLALATGSLWGKPAWGTYWQWDGRMTSVLILLLIYLGYIAIWQIIPDRRRAARLAGILAMVGIVNIPIIKFSVNWWNSLHQPASVSDIGAPGLPPEFWWPVSAMICGYAFLTAWVVMRDMQADIVKNQKRRRETKSGASAVVEKM